MAEILRIDTKWLRQILEGKTSSIIIINDNYQRGDIFRVTNTTIPCIEADDYILFKITHIYSGVGMEKNYVCLSLVQLEK